MNTPTPAPPPAEIDYPDSDGQPMSDNTLQFRWIVTIAGNLDDLYRDRPDVFVAGDLLWYPVEGDNATRTAPDAFVAFGRPKGYRGSYKQWEEAGVAPQVVWEILSPGNRRGELQAKFEFYERFGVEEYYRYDPDRGLLRGWVRRGGRLVEVENVQGWTSPRTGVSMRLEQEDLALTRPDGKPFLDFVEVCRRRDAAETLAAEERRRRLTAVARADKEQRQREAAEALAEAERLQRGAAEARAEAERLQREAAEAQAREEGARARRLAARLRELGIDPDA